MKIRVEFRRSFIRKMILIGTVILCVLFLVLGINIGKYFSKGTEVESESVYIDNGIDDLFTKRSTEHEEFVEYDSMDRDNNGNYYMETGKYSKAVFSQEYVELKQKNGQNGEMILVDRSLYDVNK